MHGFTVEFIRCVRCVSKVDLETFLFNEEIQEGLLTCQKCGLIFPIIENIPFLWDDFSRYLSIRKILSGNLYRLANTDKMKKFLKSSISNTKFLSDDRSLLEERWSKIYQNNKNSKFYYTIKNKLNSNVKSKFVLEYGCSIGIMTSYLSNSHDVVFGIDRSFAALTYAKKNLKII